MNANCRCRAAVCGGFMDLALALGAVANNHELPDEAVWDLARAIDTAHERIQKRLATADGSGPAAEVPRPSSRHPAIGHLVQRLERMAAGAGGGHNG